MNEEKSQSSMSIEDYQLMVIEERNQKIKQIETDTYDLAEAQLALNGIVSEQGNRLDDVQDHLETVIIENEKSLDCLNKRSNYEEGKMKILFALGAGAASAMMLTAFLIRPRR